MPGQADIQLPVSDKSTLYWHKSPSLSSATTDEDFLTGSPKQRWADLSEEDDDDTPWEQSPFGSLQTEVKEKAPNSAVKCAVETNMPHDGNAAHNDYDASAHGSPQFPGRGRLAAESPPARQGQHDRATARPIVPFRPGAQPFSMLPPSVDSPGFHDQVAVRAQLMQRDAHATVARQETCTVTLCGIPPKLCNDACLDAILWASGVQKSVLGYRTEKTGFVNINFCTSEAATHCYNHFKSCSWATGKLHVDLDIPHSPHLKAGYGRRSRDALSTPGSRGRGKHSRNYLA